MNLVSELSAYVSLYAAPLHTQALPAGKGATTRRLLEARTGGAARPVPKLPHMMFGESSVDSVNSYDLTEGSI